MKEFKEIIKSYTTTLAEGRKQALCSVVHVDGSSYRRPGARMLIDDIGRLTGAISGGCLEGDALRKALLVISKQESKLVTYDTSDEEDASIGIQLGCEGVIQVLFEPIMEDAEVNPIKLLQKIEAKRQDCVLVTLFDTVDKQKPQIGTCLLVEQDGTITGSVENKELSDQVFLDIKNVFEKKCSKFIKYEVGNYAVTAFIEYVAPPISLVVIGAGNDAIPMVNIADTLGWEVRVADGRNNLAKPERFVGACQVLVSKPEYVLENIPIDINTVFVLMTHNYNYDLALLKLLVKKDIKYIGSLGPKKKLDRMLEEMAEEGLELTSEERNKIYGPVGLEIGAETAEEIALSIIAEIQAVFNDKKGGMLREKPDVIHSRLNTTISYNKIKHDA
jgi:xanthine dehydrogenase accessory factor